MTVLESNRLGRLFQYFRNANISKFVIDYEPKFTGTSPVSVPRQADFGCGQHFCELQDRLAHKNVIYFEDDAILLPNFRETMNQHLAEIPEDWKILVSGHAWYKKLPENFEGENRVTENIRRNIDIFGGAQCLVLRGGEWRENLTKDMRDFSFYKCHRCGGFDIHMAKWCRKNGNPLYLATKSFVGQGGGISIISGLFQEKVGL
jgi:hypothetical protein